MGRTKDGPSLMSTTASGLTRSPRSEFSQGGSLSILSAATKQPQWSFGSASRFKHLDEALKHQKETARGARLTKARSVSSFDFSLVETPNAPMANDVLEEGDDMEENWIIESASSSPQKRPVHLMAQTAIGGFVARLDTTEVRCGEDQLHAGNPKAKCYPAARTIGEGTAPIYHHAPLFSFRGGKSRLDGLQKTDLQRSRSLTLSTGFSDQALRRRSRRKKLSRGFGSEVRFSPNGGVFSMPTSPGPAAYSVPRAMDKLPEWSTESRIPWGIRTGERAPLLNPTATDAGPGEHSADHPFQAAGPSPKIGHTLQELTDTRKGYPAPGHYAVETSIGTGPSFSIGSGSRSDTFKADPSMPCPGSYNPNPELFREKRTTAFSKSLRTHFSECIDPDDPPGPGAHNIRKEPPLRSTAWPKDEKLKEVPGQGPKDRPGPGAYDVADTKTSGWTLAPRLPAPKIKTLPSPTDYDPSFELTLQASPSVGAPSRTAPRKSIFETGSVTEASSAALLKKALASNGPVQEAPVVYQSTTPSWSLGARRSPKLAKTHSAGFVGSYSSFG